jgi:putative SOS response-associated peptidase YedK
LLAVLHPAWRAMCNLYSQTKAQEAMRSLFAGIDDRLGNLPHLPEIYPDTQAPIIRTGAAGLEMVQARWGMPTPPQFLVGKKTDRGVTNIRNVGSPHWRGWLGPAHRCLVPFTSFAERDQVRKADAWFALGEDEPIGCFAGIWTRWTSVRKLKDGPTTDELYGFLTTKANAEVGSVHPQAMPVILTEPEDWRIWLGAPAPEALKLQRPLPDGRLVRVEAPPL